MVVEMVNLYEFSLPILYHTQVSHWCLLSSLPRVVRWREVRCPPL